MKVWTGISKCQKIIISPPKLHLLSFYERNPVLYTIDVFNCRYFSLTTLPSGASFLNMPALSPTMSHGSVAAWSVKEGQRFTPGETMCEIETDKATVDFEAVDEGFLAKILVQPGKSQIEVGKPIAVVTETLERIKLVQEAFASGNDVNSKEVNKVEVTVTKHENPLKNDTNEPVKNIKVSPAAKIILETYGVEAASCSTSAEFGGSRIITKGDALNATKGKSPVLSSTAYPASQQKGVSSLPATSSLQKQDADPKLVVPFQEKDNLEHTVQSGQPLSSHEDKDFTDEELSNMRKVISARLTKSKQEAPHLYLTIDCAIDNALALRQEMKALLGNTFSINDIIILSCAKALKDVPNINLNITSKDSKLNVTQQKDIDISVAVATDNGLITPIIKSADKKGLLEINANMKDLATRARNNKLKLTEFQGGSFTISNLGMFGISEFTAVINDPQIAILAVGSAKPTMRLKSNYKFTQAYDTSGNLRKLVGQQEVEIVNIMNVTLSIDRRAADEATASLFLQCFQKYISEPKLLQM